MKNVHRQKLGCDMSGEAAAAMTFINSIATDKIMKYSIDFSLFDSSSGAYGNATGEIELDHLPEVGEEVTLPGNVCCLKVTHLTELDGAVLIGLEDKVFDSHCVRCRICGASRG